MYVPPPAQIPVYNPPKFETPYKIPEQYSYPQESYYEDKPPVFE